MEVSNAVTTPRLRGSTQSYVRAIEKPNRIGLDLMAGSIAGFTSAFFGHPLDTIKVRMQVLNHRFWSCCKLMIQQEGFKSLFKGVQSPLLSSPFVTAFSFGSYEVSKTLIGIKHGDKMTFLKGLLAGGLAGFFYAGISTPVELIKCRQQMEGAGQNMKTTGSFQMIMRTVRSEGLMGLYRGFWITALRDVPGGAIQFGAYELFKNLFPRSKEESQTGRNFIAGGLAKVTTWFFCYPQDLIKTNLQCSSGRQGMSNCVREIWARYGSAGFWKGSLPSIMRTLLSGALTFTVYEEARKQLYGL